MVSRKPCKTDHTCSGLRCKLSPTCKHWRWTTPEATLNLDMICDFALTPPNSKGGRTKSFGGCRKRRCELFHNHFSRNWAYQFSARGNYISGDKSCYKQILGQFAGCYLQDVRYTAEKKANENRIYNIYNWGDCAKKCTENKVCNFWSWSSTTCSKCIPNTCYLIKEPKRVATRKNTQTGEKTNVTLVPSEPSKVEQLPGHISGVKGCTDITYVEKDDKFLEVLPNKHYSIDLDLDFKEGPCLTSSGDRPSCPAREVPLYRLSPFAQAICRLYYRYFLQRWAVQRSFAYDRDEVGMERICRIWCLRLKKVLAWSNHLCCELHNCTSQKLIFRSPLVNPLC